MGTGGDAAEGPSSLRYAFADPITANLEGAVTFEAPELPEETLMEVSTLWAKDGRVKVKHIQRSDNSVFTAKGFASQDGAKWFQRQQGQCSAQKSQGMFSTVSFESAAKLFDP